MASLAGCGIFLGEQSQANLFVGHGVIACELRQVAVAKHITARISHM